MKILWDNELLDVTPGEKQFVVDVLERLKQSSESGNSVLRADTPETLNTELGALAVNLFLCKYTASIGIDVEHGDALYVSITPSDENKDRQILKLMEELFEIGERKEAELKIRQREREQREKEQTKQEKRATALTRLREELRKVS